ncbi:MAG: carbohydrate ABC transporter permease [Oscillospiraceae bacterium]|nr:carbohydrate ABC transporter permease [Oscillospiraceae bacterium]
MDNNKDFGVNPEELEEIHRAFAQPSEPVQEETQAENREASFQEATQEAYSRNEEAYGEYEDYQDDEEYYVPESFRTTIFKPVVGTQNLTKKQIKEIDKKNKEIRKQYHVSTWAILKNFRKYSDSEKERYRYLVGKRVASTVWPFFHYVILIGLAFVIMYPILFMATNAIRPQIETSDPSTMWIPKSLRFENFADTFNAIRIQYPNVIFSTLLVNVGCSIVQVATCAIVGYGFARFKFKGRNLLFGIVILQMIVPIQVVMIPLYMQFRYFDFFGLLRIFGMDINLIGNPLTMFIMAFFTNGIRAGLFILLFRQFFRGLPKELEDAAYLDGCGPLKTFVKVMVPNALVSFLTVFIFSVVWYWNDSYITGMLLGQESATISTAIQGENLWRTVAFYFHRTTEGVGGSTDYLVYLQAGCLMAIAPILIMYIFLQKHFVEGVERSGIVG